MCEDLRVYDRVRGVGSVRKVGSVETPLILNRTSARRGDAEGHVRARLDTQRSRLHRNFRQRLHSDCCIRADGHRAVAAEHSD